MSSETPLAVTGPRPPVGIDPGPGGSADGVLALTLGNQTVVGLRSLRGADATTDAGGGDAIP